MMTACARFLYDGVNYYHLDDWRGQSVKGRFYRPQLQKVKGLPNRWHMAQKLKYKEVQIRRAIFAAATVLLSLEGHHHQGVLLLHPRYAHCHDVHFHETLAEIRVGQTRQVLQGHIEGG